MISQPQRFEAAIRRFDDANRADPNREVFEGREHPRELLYAQRMTHWLDRLDPEASEPLRLAARSQHLCRWQIPRNEYPMDRAGYYRWRTRLYAFHAEKAGEILREVGYDAATVDRVQELLKKLRIKSDPEMQLLEDVICLVFLENYFADFSHQHDEAKLITILQKTWRKMSPQGQQAALQLPLSGEARALVEKALAAAGEVGSGKDG
jgi:hypothetical protein